MNNLKLGYVGLQSPKLQEWRTFGEVLGFGVGAESDDKKLFLRMDDRQHRIGIYEGPTDQIRHVGWDVGSEARLNGILGELKKRGIAFAEGSAQTCQERFVERLVSFKDIDGFEIELFLNPQVRSDPWRSGSPMTGGFVTGDQGMGHVVYAVPDMAATRKFYMEALGFRLTDTVDGFLKINFLRCNPRHHSLGLLQLPGTPHFQHIMIQVEDIDDVGRCLDRAEKSGIQLTCLLGRHNVERMLSFYVRTPSGFDIEYGWGAIRVDDELNWSPKVYDPGSLWGHKWIKQPGKDW